jgi:hypothetical protein
MWRSALPIAVAVISSVVFLVAAPAKADSGSTTDTTRYKCGSQCNGKLPGWVIPSNGVQCKNSKTEIASGHPAYAEKSPTDFATTVHVYYSTVCQTMWETISRTTASTDTACSYRLHRSAAPTYDHIANCAPVGQSLTTPMMDDANGGQVAGYVDVITQWYEFDGSFWGGIFEKAY